MESFIPVNGSAGNSAPVGGRHHKLKLVTKKAARKALKKLGMKMRGGEDAPVVVDEKTKLPVTTGGADPSPVQPGAAATAAPAMGGRRRKTRKGGKKSHRRGLFGY
jgi:hypothetical protein